MYTLGIETSCDETSCAVLKHNRILANCTLSSVHLYKKYGGVIPEIASRRQYEYLHPVFQGALKQAGIHCRRLQLISAVQGPGLIGSLLVGTTFAKALSFSLGRPYLGVDHLAAHLYAPFFAKPSPEFPLIGYVISGGHTHLYLMKDFDKMVVIGKTRDDAAGEVFDKVSRVFGLGYPGGPAIDRLFREEYKNYYPLKCGKFLGGFDTSFSGIKTSVIYKKEQIISRKEKTALLSSFQETIVNALADTAIKAARDYKVKTIVCGGGVTANRRLREVFREKAQFCGVKAFFPETALCADNAANAAGLARQLYQKGYRSALSEGVYSRAEGSLRLP
jgi:N6-L-threonylcarbamoyladenine synthase